MPAMFIASCQSPLLVEPSPPLASTTPSSPRILKASAVPAACGYWTPMGAEGSDYGVVPVVRVHVIVARAEVVRGADLGGLLALAGDDEGRLALAVQDPGPLVGPAREQHKA